MVRMIARWGLPSPETRVRATVTEAGAATVGGVKAPCAPIVKVAGRRTFVGGLGVVAVEGPVEVSVRADWRARVRFFRAGFGFLSVEAMAAGVEAVVRVEA